jgi:hypothetical protein
MDVIGHEEIGMDRDAVALAIPLQTVQICEVIRRIVKNECPPVAARNDMEKGAGEFDAGFASHAGHPMRRILNLISQ